MSYQLAASHLSGAVSGIIGGGLSNDDTYRRYRSALTFSVFANGAFNHPRRSIFYEVGRHYNSKEKALSATARSAEFARVDASIRTNEVEAANFAGWSRKHSNFAPDWSYMDLAAIVERLAKGVAAQSIYGGVDTEDLRGSTPLRVTTLGTLDAPVTASNSSVFIPRVVDSLASQDVFSVLTAAANGEGAGVVTDVLRLDTNTNQPLVPSVEGPSLGRACVEALRILGANYEVHGASDIFVYALTRGIHSVVSVVGHTDEGGWLRGALRSGCFRVPYGGVNSGICDYPQLPPVSGLHMSAVAGWVDSIALKTAALVAHCDPCITTVDGVFPTVFTSNQTTRGSFKDLGKGSGADGQSIGLAIGADLGRFLDNYIPGLLKLFGLSGNSGVAGIHFGATAQHYLSKPNDRHLRYETVAPYFWIEPTSLIPHDFLGTLAESAGFGAMGTSGMARSMPAFEEMEETGRGANANFATIAFKMRSARTSALISAMAAESGALTPLRLYQFDTSSIAMEGAGGDREETLRAKHNRAAPISDYLWTRGQSCIPAPAEFLNTQGVYGAKYKVVTWDDDFNGSFTGLPEPWELESHPITLRCTVPTAIDDGPANAATRDSRHSRCRAAIALSQAALRNRAAGDANSPIMEVSDVPPTLKGKVSRPSDDHPDRIVAEHDPHTGPGYTRAVAAAPPSDPDLVDEGRPAPPVVHLDSNKGPKSGAPIERGARSIAPLVSAAKPVTEAQGPTESAAPLPQSNE